MFGKKKKEDKKDTNNEKLDFGDNNYQMKDKYEANSLVVANLEIISNEITDFGSPKIETTKQKYIFEIIDDNNIVRYREIFTGFIADEKTKYFMLPYVTNIKPFTDYFLKTTNEIIPKLSLIWAQNDINFPKQVIINNKSKKYKKKKNIKHH